METFLLFGIKATICTGVFLGYYYIFLKDKTFHHYNRFYLLSALLLSLLIPFIKVEQFTVDVNENIYLLISKIQYLHANQQSDSNEYYYLASGVATLLSAGFLIKLVSGIFKIHKLKASFSKERIHGINFYSTDLPDAPFSYFRNLFWKNSIAFDSDAGRVILKHEMVHIEQKHTVDKIITEIIVAVFWFNPFGHLIKKELNLIHEYLADSKSVKNSDTKAFARLLLESHFPGYGTPAASPFFNSNLKKRLKMLQKSKTKYGYARRIFVLPLLFSVTFAYMVNARNKEINTLNTAVEKVAFQIRKDTVSPKQDSKTEIAEKITNEKIKIQSYEKNKSENEYADFYKKAENDMKEALKKSTEAKRDLTEKIESERNKMAFDEKFPKYRDYDKNPLTLSEKQELKADAEKIAKMSQKVNDANTGNFGLFKFEKTSTKVFDIHGNEMNIEAKAPVGTVNMMAISVDGAELFVNGKKVSKEEFLSYQTDFKNLKIASAKIKLLAIERVGDRNRSYAKKMEIITN